MKVAEICTRDVKFCDTDTSLADAGWMMGKGRFGALPVVDAGVCVIGIITDRDICIGVANRYRAAADIVVRELLGDQIVRTCTMDDDVWDVLKTLREANVRRLPVVDQRGRLKGIISLSDIARTSKAADESGNSNVVYDDVAYTLKVLAGERQASAGNPLVSARQPTK